MVSHVTNPTPLRRSDECVRVYFGCRDADQRAHIAWIDIQVRDAPRVVAVASAPALSPGALGHFDDHGVHVASIVERDGSLWMYYSGWNPGKPPLYYSSIGLAVSDDGGSTFKRASRAPILARSDVDPWMVSGPCVLRDDGFWRMWYISGIDWVERDGALHSRYDIKHARSDDGVTWRPDAASVLPLGSGEMNICRPWVTRSDREYHMWFAADAGSGYRLATALSHDGLVWQRNPPANGIELSSQGWDSTDMTYPATFVLGRCEYLVYAGNDCGRGGIGLARREAGD